MKLKIPNNIFETIIGAVVIFISVFFLIFAKIQSDTIPDDLTTYKLIAKFDKIDGINIGSDVRMAGIKIGVILDQELDTETYEAVLEFNIASNIKIPSDTIASVVSSGLLGKKYLSLDPGAEEIYLKDGEQIIHTQSSINIETLIGKFAFGDKSKSF
jgi:phospholipid/cholesterol/gamma-HCH transport system substrate-binding protein